MATLYLTPKAARGRRIRIGARVRIVGVLDLSGIRDPRARRSVEAVFRRVKGRCKKARGFSRHGFAEIFFKIRSGRLAGWHGIEIEPNHLLVQPRRR